MFVIPAWLISASAGICALMCLYSFFRYKDTLAGGFAFPLLFFAFIYGYYATAVVDINVRQLWVRPAILLLIFVIGVWRSVELIRKGGGDDS